MPHYRLAGGSKTQQIFPGEDLNGYDGLASGSSISHWCAPGDFYSDPERAGFRYDAEYPWQAVQFRASLELYDYKKQDSIAAQIKFDSSNNPTVVYEAPRTWRDPIVFDLAVITGAVVVTPGTGQLVFTGFAPTIKTPVVIKPGVGVLTLTGFAPLIKTPVVTKPGVGSLLLSGFAPTVTGGGAITDRRRRLFMMRRR